jgi:hypothetical protein
MEAPLVARLCSLSGVHTEKTLLHRRSFCYGHFKKRLARDCLAFQIECHGFNLKPSQRFRLVCKNLVRTFLFLKQDCTWASHRCLCRHPMIRGASVLVRIEFGH